MRTQISKTIINFSSQSPCLQFHRRATRSLRNVPTIRFPKGHRQTPHADDHRMLGVAERRHRRVRHRQGVCRRSRRGGSRRHGESRRDGSTAAQVLARSGAHFAGSWTNSIGPFTQAILPIELVRTEARKQNARFRVCLIPQ